MTTPEQLRRESFAQYPAEAQALATMYLPLLRSLPLVFAPFLLREIATFDWKLPPERLQLREQLRYAASLPAPELRRLVSGFEGVRVTPAVAGADWVDDPAGFIEQLTAWLWSSHQMDHFHAAADSYAEAMSWAVLSRGPDVPRLGMVVIGSGVEGSATPLFRKLRPHGVYLAAVKPRDGFAVLLAAAGERAAKSTHEGKEGGRGDATEPAAGRGGMRHWYIDGGRAEAGAPGLTTVSYAALAPPREQLLLHTQRAMATGSMGPERLRSMLAHLQPRDLGLPDGPADAALSHFQVSLLTEGSGTQIFATTFAQWAARECVRRAQPETLLVRFAPRQQAQTMDAMLRGAPLTGLDAAGSLVDADQGAYYTWLNMRRLPGAESLRFLVWFEEQREALVIGPGLPGGTTSHTPMDLRGVLQLLV